MVRKLVLAVAAASALMSSGMVQALGVGDINLRSALNQPLDAEIELLQVRDLSSAEIRPVLASPDDFGRAGIDRSFFLTDLTFTPVIQPNGKAYIKVTSSRAVREPYLNFLMEVRWPSGRVLREFTLLLDPPLYDPTPVTMAAPVVPPASSSAGAVRTQPPVAAPPRQVATPPVQAGASVAAPTSRQNQHRSTRDETLWGIALRVRPAGSSVQQTMLAIQDLNPNAFIGNNINSLKAGQTLTLPTAEQTAVRSRAEANAEVAAQTAAWQNRQPATAAAQRQLDARERTVAAEAPAQSPLEDSLRLVAGSADSGDDSASSSGGDGGLRNTLDQTREQLDSAEQAKAELAERLADVEGQLETLQRLLTLKDTQLAALQRELADADTALPDILPAPEEPSSGDAAAGLAEPDSAAPAEQPAEVTDVAGIADAASAEENQQDTTPEQEEEGEQLAATPVAPASETGSDQGEGKPAAASEPTVSAQSQTAVPETMLQRLMQNQSLLLGTGAVALLVLLLILMAVARRNARREAELMENLAPAAAGGAVAATSLAAEEGNAFNVAVADADADTEPHAHIHPEESLQPAAFPDEQEFSNFVVEDEVLPVEALASEVDSDLLPQSMSEFQPEPEQTPEGGLPEIDETEFDLADFGLEGEVASSLASATEEEEIGFDLDFDLDDTGLESPETAPAEIDLLQADGFSFESPVVEPAADDFDLNLDEELQADNLLAEFEALDKGQAVVGQNELADEDFSLTDEDLAGFEAQLQSAMHGEEDDDFSVTAQTVGAEALDGQDSGELVSEGLDEDFDFLSDTDECATKLDLARAYIDMGDQEGARDILAEVVEEGNEQQQQDAREMMEQLG